MQNGKIKLVQLENGEKRIKMERKKTSPFQIGKNRISQMQIYIPCVWFGGGEGGRGGEGGGEGGGSSSGGCGGAAIDGPLDALRCVIQ